jgi:DNA processing protein
LATSPSLKAPPPRCAPFYQEPGFYEDGGVWLYGNAKALKADLAYIPGIFGESCQTPAQLDAISAEAMRIVMDSQVLVCGVHNIANQRAAVVPLRWGAPRILVLSGGFKYHLGENFDQEPFRAAKLWRNGWDPLTDLAISRRAPDKLPTYASHNPTIDRMIKLIVNRQWPGLLFEARRP